MTAPAAHVGRLGLLARGVAMGTVEVIPGVSGGTIAFVTGIYDELVRSLASFSGASAATLFRDGWRSFADRHNLSFLLLLGSGMAVGLLTAGKIVQLLLQSHGAYVMAAFFGVVAGSLAHVGAQASWRWLASLGVAGVALGFGVGVTAEVAEGVEPARSMALVFVAGALASTAWILPGLSGAFVLLLLGLYQPMLDAFFGGDVAVVATFAAGLGVGLIAFAKLLGWLLKRAREPSLALLTGFMAGSLMLLWPWRVAGAAEASPAGILATMLISALTVGGMAIAVRAKKS